MTSACVDNRVPSLVSPESPGYLVDRGARKPARAVSAVMIAEKWAVRFRASPKSASPASRFLERRYLSSAIFPGPAIASAVVPPISATLYS